jgi:hypothetical protein
MEEITNKWEPNILALFTPGSVVEWKGFTCFIIGYYSEILGGPKEGLFLYPMFDQDPNVQKYLTKRCFYAGFEESIDKIRIGEGIACCDPDEVTLIRRVPKEKKVPQLKKGDKVTVVSHKDITGKEYWSLSAKNKCEFTIEKKIEVKTSLPELSNKIKYLYSLEGLPNYLFTENMLQLI